MKKLFILMAALCCLAGAWAQYLESPQILETNTTQSNVEPSVITWRYSITQQIYTAAELNLPQCYIQGISFYHNTTYTGGLPRHVKIYLGATAKTNFADSTFVGLTSSMKLVYTGDIVADPVAGWVPIEFDNYFEYSGASNLVLCVIDATGSYSTYNIARFDSNNSSGVHTMQRYSDTEALTLNSDGTVTGEGGSFSYTGERNVVKFFYGYQPYNSDQLMEWDRKDMFPFTSAWCYSRSQQILEASELGIDSTYIVDFSLLQATGGSTARTLKIWMKNTTQSSYSSVSAAVSTDEMTLVYDGTLQTNAEAGWLDIKLLTPFFYEGNNLLIATEDLTGSYPAIVSSRPYFATDGRKRRGSLYRYSDSQLADGYQTTYDVRNVIRVNGAVQVGDTVPYRVAGNTLYYKIGASSATVVAPGNATVANCRWGDYEQPSGIVVVPDTIVVGHLRQAVKGVGSRALAGLQNITEVRLPDCMTSLDSYAFAYSSVTTVSIPPSVKYLYNATFQNCQQLDSLTIADGTCWTDAWDTWKNCKALTDIDNGYMRFHSDFAIRYKGAIGDTLLNVPSYIHTLGCYCYYYATDNLNVTEVMLGENMQQLLNYPFFRMSNIRRINVQATTPPAVVARSFWTYDSQTNASWRDLTQQAVLYVPYSDDHSVIAAYRAHSVWGTFADIRESPRYNVSLAFANADAAAHAMLLLDWRTDILQKQVAEHSDVVLYVVPFEHCDFTGWSDGNTDNPRTVRITSNRQFYANVVAQTFTVGIDAGNYGTVTGATSGAAHAWGTTLTLTATPDRFHNFAGWSDGNTDNPRTVTVTQDSTFTATWSPKQFTLTIYGTGICGTVTGAGTYDWGTPVTVTATPFEHYEFAGWVGGGTENPCIVYVNQNTTIKATWRLVQHTITLTAGDHGTVSGSGSFDWGSYHTISATPDEHYEFAGWSDGNTQNPRVLTISGDLNLSASFRLQQHTLAVSAGGHGTVSGAGSYGWGTSATISATPDEHYEFAGWSDGNTDNPRTVTVSGDLTFSATWRLRQHTLAVSAGDHGTVSGSGTYDWGTAATITATPDAHYEFAGWSDGNTDNPRTVTVSGDLTFSATWRLRQHTLAVSAGDHGTVSGSGTYDWGAAATITATPDEHYEFAGWSDGNTDNPRTVTVSGDITLSASFRPKNYTLSAGQAITGGEVTGYGTYAYGTQAVLTAVPAEGYIFKQWSDGSTDNPLTVTVEGDTVISPVFEQLSGLESTAAEKARKVMIDGQVYILRDGKTYNIFGQQTE